MADAGGKTPLRMAIEAGHYEIFVLLIKECSIHDMSFITDIHVALQFASDGGLDDIAQLLIWEIEELNEVPLLCLKYVSSKIGLDVEWWISFESS